MLKFQAQVYRVNDIAGWDARKELVLAPGFQRRSVWSPKGRSYLIDSILRGLPLPQFFIREVVHPKEKRIVREVVDGQQRIASILGYMQGKFTVFKTHNESLGGTMYDDLPEEVQRAFLSFPLSVNILEGTEDQDVLEIFSRINAYTVPLNAQEKLNAKFVGAFKGAMDRLAREHIEFWKRNRVLLPQAITRMKDVELTAELVGAMLFGLQNMKAIIGSMYEKYDDSFPQGEFIAPRFGEVLQVCEQLLNNEMEGTIFRRSPIFYSLFCAAYECMYGLQADAQVKGRYLAKPNLMMVQQKLFDLSSMVEEKSPSAAFDAFYKATIASQNKLPQRVQMHQTLVSIISQGF